MLTKTGGVQGTGSYLFPFLVIIALVVTQLVGFETAGAFAEETTKSRIKPSQAIIAGLGGTALILFIFDFALLLAIPGVGPAMKDEALIPDVLTSALGSGFTKLFLVAALIAVFSTAVATLATIVRMIYGMARNGQLPGASFLTKLSGRTTEPTGAIIVAAVLSVIPLIFIKRIPVIVAAITALIIIPYILVLAAQLRRRLQGWPQQPAKFNLGKWGLPVTIAGLVWTIIILLDSAWPREITNPKLGPLPVIEDLGIGMIVVGLIWWYASLRYKSQALPPVTARPPAPPPGRRQEPHELRLRAGDDRRDRRQRPRSRRAPPGLARFPAGRVPPPLRQAGRAHGRRRPGRARAHPGGAGPLPVRLQLGDLGGRPLAADGVRGRPRSALGGPGHLGIRRGLRGRHVVGAGTADTYRQVEQLPAKVAGHLPARCQGRPCRVRTRPGQHHGAAQGIADQVTSQNGPARDASRLLSALRMIKSPAEIERVRKSVSAATAGYQAGLQAASAGMTEKELVAIIGSAMHANGSTAGTKPLFVNCVSGRQAYPLVDSPASDNVIAEGDIVFVDGGGASDGYVSDILRLIGVGQLRAEDRRYAEVAAGATQAAIDVLRPGIRVSEIIRTASRYVAAEGVTDPVGSIAGHGIGLELWERPLITEPENPDDDVAVRENMVLCIEPILAPPHPEGGLAGIFVFEQQVLVTATGCEVLSGALPATLWETA